MLGRVIATGNFDGLHQGHRRILDIVNAEATSRGLEPLAVTYEPHTRHFLGTPGVPALLTPPLEKKDLFHDFGMPLEQLSFTPQLAGMSGLEYVRDIVIAKYRAQVWVFGPNHRFGAGGKGSIEEVSQAFPGLKIIQLDSLFLESGLVSSSRIRDALEEGNLDLANGLLGRSYCLEGLVVPGDARGRQIGFPTANILVEPFKQLPKFGVYAGWAKFEGEEHLAVVNIGLRPTFDGQNPSVEVHLPEWAGDLYGKRLQMKLDLFLRGEMRFSGVDSLTSQITCDVQRAQSVLNQRSAH
jgi:riboflavin kinase/FMN adenylyltransferase